MSEFMTNNDTGPKEILSGLSKPDRVRGKIKTLGVIRVKPEEITVGTTYGEIFLDVKTTGGYDFFDLLIFKISLDFGIANIDTNVVSLKYANEELKINFEILDLQSAADQIEGKFATAKVSMQDLENLQRMSCQKESACKFESGGEEEETEVLFMSLKPGEEDDVDSNDEDLDVPLEEDLETEVLFSSVREPEIAEKDSNDTNNYNDEEPVTPSTPLQVQFVGLEMDFDDENNNNFDDNEELTEPPPILGEEEEKTEPMNSSEEVEEEEELLFKLDEDDLAKHKNITSLTSEGSTSEGLPISPLTFDFNNTYDKYGSNSDEDDDEDSSPAESTDTTSSSDEEQDEGQHDENISLLFQKNPSPTKTPKKIQEEEEEEEEIIVPFKEPEMEAETKNNNEDENINISEQEELQRMWESAPPEEEQEQEKPKLLDHVSTISTNSLVLSPSSSIDEEKPFSMGQLQQQVVNTNKPPPPRQSLLKPGQRLSKYIFTKLELKDEGLQPAPRPPSLKKEQQQDGMLELHEDNDPADQKEFTLGLESVFEFEEPSEGVNIMKANCIVCFGSPVHRIVVSLYDNTVRIFDTKNNFHPLMVISRRARTKNQFDSNPLFADTKDTTKRKRSFFGSRSEDGDDFMNAYRGPSLAKMEGGAVVEGGIGRNKVPEKCMCTHLIQWDKSKFLCGYRDGIVISYSVKTYEKQHEFPDFCSRDDSSVLRLQKLNKTTFLCLYKGHELVIINYPKRKVLQRLEKERVTPYTQIEMSSTFRKCFYINTGDKHKSVKLIHHESGVCLNRFSSHRSVICTMKSIPSNKNFKRVYKDDKMELLFVAGYTDSVYVYRSRNILLSIDTQSKKLKKGFSQPAEVIMKIAFPCYVYSSLLIKNRYLVFGDGDGVGHVYDTHEKLNVPRKLCHVLMANGFIFDIAPFYMPKEAEKKLKKDKSKDVLGVFMSCSDDRRVKVIKFVRNKLFKKKKKKK